VRHPNILSFLHSTEAEVPDGPAMKHTIYIVTEPVVPLSEKLKELNLGSTQRYHQHLVLFVIIKFSLFSCRKEDFVPTGFFYRF
jgi:hypothetical protein